MTSTLIHIATIGPAHGIRGQVKLRSFTANPKDILTCSPLTDKSGKRQFVLMLHGMQEDVLLVSIEGITDRNEAELLKGTELYAPATAFTHKKKANEWLVTELVGLEGRTPDGKAYGRITSVHNFGAGDILEFTLADSKTEMLPFKDRFIGEIHADQGYLVVLPPVYVEAKE